MYRVCTFSMSELRFEWGPRKAATNLRKHGVSFSEAQTAFTDEHGLYEERMKP